MKRLAYNGDFALWTGKYGATPPGVTIINANGTASGCPRIDGWGGGAGPGGSITFTTGKFSPGFYGFRNQARQYAQWTWTSNVTSGNQGDYPGTNRSTYIEQSAGQKSPEYGMGEVFTFSFDGWSAAPLRVVPIVFVAMGQNSWLTGQMKAVGDYIQQPTTAGFYGVYQAASADNTGSGPAPSHTSGTVSDGNVQWTYVGSAKGRSYEIFEAGPYSSSGQAYVAMGNPDPSAVCNVLPTGGRYSVDIALPKIGASFGVYSPARTLLQPEDNTAFGGGKASVSVGFDLLDLPTSGTVLNLHNVEVRNDGVNRYEP